MATGDVMHVYIITQFRTKPGLFNDLIALIARLLPESLDHDGCLEVCIQQNQDDPNDVISVQKWASRRHYDAYRTWRKKNGVTHDIEEFLTEAISVRYFDEVPMMRPDSRQSAEVPKVGSADALGG